MIGEILLTLIIGPFLYVLMNYINHILNLKKYPNGPFPLPIIGNLHSIIGKRPFESLRDLSKKYGDVFSLSFGMQRVVVINDIQNAEEALITKGADFLGRPRNYTSDLLTEGGKGVTFIDDQKQLTFIRKIAHQSLKLFGDGMEKMEKLVLEECNELTKRLSKYEESPVNVNIEIGCSVTNVICYVLLGKRYQSNDPEFLSILEFTTTVTKGFRNGDPVAVFPWLRFFPLESVHYIKIADKLRRPLMQNQYQQHKSTFDPDKIRDVMDSFILSAQDLEKWKENGFDEVTDDNVKVTIQDLLIAGSDPVKTNLHWAILFLLHWPKFQGELYEELQSVCKGNSLELKDKGKCDLMEAFLNEVLRYASITPLSLPHKTKANTSVQGKPIPKDTQVFFNLWAMHNDTRQWEKPEEFNPYRWLNKDRKFDGNMHESFLPFSAGRRSCFGEVLARVELFLIFSTIVSQFEILPCFNGQLPSLEGEAGITYSPTDYCCIFRRRNLNK